MLEIPQWKFTPQFDLPYKWSLKGSSGVSMQIFELILFENIHIRSQKIKKIRKRIFRIYKPYYGIPLRWYKVFSLSAVKVPNNIGIIDLIFSTLCGFGKYWHNDLTSSFSNICATTSQFWNKLQTFPTSDWQRQHAVIILILFQKTSRSVMQL